MKKGFVFGKYLPFHIGHKALIDFALTRCDFLYIVICCSNKETIASKIRASWLQKVYNTSPNIKIIEFEYDEKVLPNTSISSVQASKIWADQFKSMLPHIDLLVTSEKYGDYVAEFMMIEHIPFDQQRIQFPISSTQIRESLYDHWDFLPDIVKKYYQKKVVFLGTESTGKSSLSKYVSDKFNASLVEETARKIVQHSNHFSENQLEQIALEHAKNIKQSCNELKPIVFIDTDVHITQSYAKYRFGKYLTLVDDIYLAKRADIYFYLTKDIRFVQDGTRMHEIERNLLDKFHRNTLNHFGIQFTEIPGDWHQRLAMIELTVNELIEKQIKTTNEPQ